MRKLVSSGARRIFQPSWAKKVTLTAVIGSGVIVGSVYADSMNNQSTNDNLSSVYHVYMGDKHIGTFDQKETIQDFIDEQEKQAENDHYQDNVDLVPSEEIDFVEEMVFSTKHQSDQVKSTLKEDLSFVASAIEIKAGDQVLGYVNNLDEANEAVNQVISQYLPEGVDQSINLLKDDSNDLDQTTSLSSLLPDNLLQTGTLQNREQNDDSSFNETIELDDGSTVIDVGFTKDVTVTETKVDAQQLLEVQQLVKLLERGTETQQTYTVQENDAITTVASKHDISTDELIELNPDIEEDSVIQVGQEMKVTGMSSLVDVSYTETVTEEETIEYEEVVEKTDELYKGDSEVAQQGSDGKKEVTYEVEVENGEEVSREKVDENVIEEAQDKIVKEGTKVVPSRGTGNFVWPAVGGYVTSTYGPRWGSHHNGMDIAGVSNRTLKAADNGTVVEAGYHSGGHGNRVIIDHNNGYRTLYAHLSSISVSPGQTVRKGQAIGQMGSTGRSTGVHLHLELQKNGRTINPGPYFR
ncbi:murein DD-endopeptidase MepM/ murein hydrolase activator NlpD [Alkalibacillus flavidus]|uniref:Murein DD-endopeptidase MepM/ murein hydrolase activator NlpD n=1 Tax=Alkalibacillus flavidus TaxID=546021 RepID=A0ABV2KW96_9BACI